MLARQAGADLFMVGSDWPHAEGVRDPGVSSRRVVQDLSEADQELILSQNIGELLGI
jgi:predicted TIM-barrel fold metal-dependent hydrolase